MSSPPAAPAKAPSLAHTQQAPAAPPPTAAPIAAFKPLPADCTYGKVTAGGWATVIRENPSQKLGMLFSMGGSFAAKPVDEPCDPGQEAGPFPVSAGGALVARLTGSPPAPNKWSLYNAGTSMRIVFEPLLGEGQYGPGQVVVEFAIPAEKTAAEMGGSWPGPGRLRASTGAPGGSGPLTGSCFEQGYTASAEITEVYPNAPALPGMSFSSGDRVVTENVWGRVLIAGSNLWIGPGSDVVFEPQVAADTRDLAPPEWWVKLKPKADELARAGYVRPEGYGPGQDAFWSGYRDGTLAEAYERIKGIEDPCLAAVELKLYLDAHQDEFTLGKATDLGVDLIGIWLLPNKWDAVDSWGKWAFGKLPGVGYVSTAQNVLDSWDRVKKDWVPTVARQKGAWALAAYEKSKAAGWTEAQIVEEQRARQDEANAKLAEIEQLRQAFEAQARARAEAFEQQVAEIKAASDARLVQLERDTLAAWQALKPELDAMPEEDRPGPQIADRRSLKQIREDEFWQEWRGKRATEELSRGASISAIEVPHTLQMQGLANAYEREVTARLTEAARLQTEQQTLEKYNKPISKKDCPKEEGQPSLVKPDPCTGPKLIEIGVRKGVAHLIKQKTGPAGEALIHTLSVNLDRIYSVKPDGTDFSVEKREDAATVRVFEGQVTISAPDGFTLTVAEGQQATLPQGEVTPLDSAEPRRFAGLPLAVIRLDADEPQPYGELVLRAEGDALPEGWLWQEPNKDLNGPGDSTLEIVSPTALRVTVPNENDFWGHRSDAPRLLHKVTGDFDLEADLLLESVGKHFAISEFLLFVPQAPVGYLQGQMNPDGFGASYLVAGGGWSHWENASGQGVVNRPWSDAAPAPDGPIRVRFARRGSLLKGYWSHDGGATWNLATRRQIDLPETIWAGWLFKRMAHDGLNADPAITTLSGVRLLSAPLGSLPDSRWDLIGHQGHLLAEGRELTMTRYGQEGGYLQAYSPWAIDGDLDLIVSYEASPLEAQPDQERHVHVALTSNDESDHAYVRQVAVPGARRHDADMAINAGWYRWRSEPTEGDSGRIRLVRREGIFTGYIWRDGAWAPLADWQQGFASPVYLDLRLIWNSPEPQPQSVRFVVERLETEAGLLIGDAEASEPAPSVDGQAAPAEAPAEPTVASPVDKEVAGPQPETTPTAPGAAPAASSQQRQSDESFLDDFSSDILGWSVRDGGTVATGYEAQGYSMWVKRPEHWGLSRVPSAFTPIQVAFDAVVMPGSAGGMYGVICHFRDQANYDFVAIDPETRSVTAGRMAGGALLSLATSDGRPSPFETKRLTPLVTAINRIEVGCYEDRLEVAIGGAAEAVWPLDPPGAPSPLALFVYGFGELGPEGYKVLFDNLEAYP